MRSHACSTPAACPGGRLTVRQAAVAVAVALAVALAAGCSSDSSTGPTTNQNIELMVRFDSVLGTLNPETQDRRREQLSEAITLLAFGAPVQTVQLTVDGTTKSYMGVGGFIVSDDIEGHALDSAYTLIAWRGDAADTLASVAIFQGLSTFELTHDSIHVGSAGQATGAAHAHAPGAACTSFLDHLPGDVTVPDGVTCHDESVTISASGNTDTTPAAGTFAVPSQTVNSVRLEGQTGG